MNLTTLKSTIAQSVLACSFAFAAFAPSSQAIAQDGNTYMVVTVPFAFHGGPVVMPAGNYQIGQLSSHILTVRGSSQKRSEILLTNSAITPNPSSRGKLIFHRYGDQYFLYQIWSRGQATGYELPRSRAEKETLRADNSPAPSTIELALNASPQR